MQTASVDLLSNASATSSAKQWPGGKGVFAVKATFSGGTVALQFQLPDSTTWITPTDGTLYNDGGFVFELPPCLIRASVATATAVYATAVRIPE